MIRALLVALALAAHPARAQQPEIALPSGRIVMLHDVIVEADAQRFRFLEPDLAMVIDFVPYDALEADMHYLCETWALDHLDGATPALIHISIADRPVEFGTQDPEAAQVFEAYRPEGDTCIWEGF